MKNEKEKMASVLLLSASAALFLIEKRRRWLLFFLYSRVTPLEGGEEMTSLNPLEGFGASLFFTI